MEKPLVLTHDIEDSPDLKRHRRRMQTATRVLGAGLAAGALTVAGWNAQYERKLAQNAQEPKSNTVVLKLEKPTLRPSLAGTN